jgi:ABC-type uncharacterized transport system substrate-binding protein
MINKIETGVATSVATQGLKNGAVQTSGVAAKNVFSEVAGMGNNDDRASVSTLASQLSESAIRAQERDSSMGRKELGEAAAQIIDKIAGRHYFTNKQHHDKEVPDTQDPALIARAKQATEYINSVIYQKPTDVKNPFADLTNEQLALIAYDEGGSYTVNERYAASQESFHREAVWREMVVSQAMDEYSRTGDAKSFFEEVLSHYEGLPAIEQAQYPANYAQDLKDKIGVGADWHKHIGEGMDARDVMTATLSSRPPMKSNDGNDAVVVEQEIQ